MMFIDVHGNETAPPPAQCVPARGHSSEVFIHAESGRAYYRGRRIDFTVSEYRAFAAIAGSDARDVSYREIYDAVKGVGFVAGSGSIGYRANVRSQIKRVRRKLAAAGVDPERIVVYPGFGYRWMDGDPERLQ